MNTALSGKAAANHTHELDDVILTYEEEEETNGETSTITKTKTLSNILNGKAEATHTHTLSEITNYTAPDLSNCAQLNATTNTFTGKIQTNNLGVENRMDVYQGVINIFNCNAIDTWNNTTSSLGSNLQAAISSLITDSSNTFTASQTFKGNITLDEGINITNTNTTACAFYNSNGSKHIWLGQSFTQGNSGNIYFNYAGNDHTNNAFVIGFHTHGDKYWFFKDRMVSNVPLTVDGDITCGSAFKINNTSYDACYFYNSNGDKLIYLGQSWSQGNCSYLRFNYVGNDNISNSFSIGFHSYGNVIYFHRNRIQSDVNISAPNFYSTSDRRLKENINELTDEENIIDKVKVYSFNLKNDTEEPKRKHYGVIAQELDEIAPELVYINHNPNNDDILSVNYIELIPHLINKIHQQDKRINELEAKVNKLCELLTA